MLTVEASAIRVRSWVYMLSRPRRHHDVIRFMREECGITEAQNESWEQGFVLSNGHFATRLAAAEVAIKAGQVAVLKWPPSLFSEDLW